VGDEEWDKVDGSELPPNSVIYNTKQTRDMIAGSARVSKFSFWTASCARLPAS